MDTLIQRLAKTLFELSLESEASQRVIEEAVFLRDTLKDSEIKGFLVHPHILDMDKLKLLQNLFKDKISSGLMGFLHLAVSKSREAYIVPALSLYIDMANRHRGKVVAKVVSATELKKEQIADLCALLSKKLDKEVEMTVEIDPQIIGGFYIHVDGRLIDCTLRSQLRSMKESIKRGVVV